jgi:hypothetical protein
MEDRSKMLSRRWLFRYMLIEDFTVDSTFELKTPRQLLDWYEEIEPLLSLSEDNSIRIPDSCLMQDEPERGTGFSCKMSLKGE